MFRLSCKTLPTLPISVALAITLILLPAAARANDGGIALGGTPKLLRSHRSVRMESERVRMDVYDTSLRVTCDFVFYNTGATCKVRMGFPDTGDGAYDPDMEQSDPMSQPPRTTFDSFQSFVNGAAVATKLIRADEEGKFWHTKSVEFPARQRVHVRDIYTQPVSGSVAAHGTFSNIGYILHTGSSWHGNIGKTTLVVIFHRKTMQGTLTARPAPADLDARNWASALPTSVYYIGPGKPVITGNTLRFERTNWRPSEKDDLTLFFKDWHVAPPAATTGTNSSYLIFEGTTSPDGRHAIVWGLKSGKPIDVSHLFDDALYHEIYKTRTPAVNNYIVDLRKGRIVTLVHNANDPVIHNYIVDQRKGGIVTLIRGCHSWAEESQHDLKATWLRGGRFVVVSHGASWRMRGVYGVAMSPNGKIAQIDLQELIERDTIRHIDRTTDRGYRKYKGTLSVMPFDFKLTNSGMLQLKVAAFVPKDNPWTYDGQAVYQLQVDGTRCTASLRSIQGKVSIKKSE